MTGEEAVRFYHALQRFGIQPGLERIRALCAKLGDPQDRLRFVHVAGTNGKGSVCTELANILCCAGYRTGLYTSPYVIDFRERICLNGEMIPPDALGAVTEQVKAAMDALREEAIFPTEFEAVTAAAFLYYAEEKCDVVVLETGLGGRFDATNIIKTGLISVITSVSLDHTGVLGDTVAQIAFEKAGIIKPGRPVVISSSQKPDVFEVLRSRAKAIGAPLYTADAGQMFQPLSADMTGTVIRYNGQDLKIPFPGEAQRDNASLVLKAIELLSETFRLRPSAIKTGMETAFIPARTEMLCDDPFILLDGSHNDGSTAALSALVKKFLYNKKILAVMGIMADKDHAAVLSNLLPCFAAVVCVTPSNPRALPSAQLCRLIASYGVEAIDGASPAEGIDKALSLLPAYDALVGCGSLYLAGAVREYLKSKLHQTDE